MKTATLTVLLLLGPVPDAFAWGAEGHRIVADIAEQLLEPETAHQVHDLLATENATTLAEVSTWADQMRAQRRETGPWHYVNIPIDPPAGTSAGYDHDRDCPTDTCVVAKIDEFARDLHDRTLDERRRLEALKFVVHLVADVHQPLHCADDHDRGGNDVHVRFLGRSTNLHAFWDTAILAPAVSGDERSYALGLAHAITPAESSAWSKGSPADWATESYGVARTAIYSPLPRDGETLPPGYADRMLPVVDEQLERAGVRLAAVLNRSLR